MKKTIIYSVVGLIILFIGINIGAKTTISTQVREFEIHRHQNLATEIDIQIKLLKLMSDNKASDADTLLVKWIEQNICEMGAYKHSKFYESNTEISKSILNTKQLLAEKRVNCSDCVKKTFSEYSGFNNK